MRHSVKVTDYYSQECYYDYAGVVITPVPPTERQVNESYSRMDYELEQLKNYTEKTANTFARGYKAFAEKGISICPQSDGSIIVKYICYATGD